MGDQLVLRDLVHDALGRWAAVCAVLVGAVLSFAVSPPFVAVASATAFLVSELADTLVYARLRRGGWRRALLASNAVGLVIDSMIFLLVAFGSLDFLAGNVLGKVWMTLLAFVALEIVRRRGDRVPVTA